MQTPILLAVATLGLAACGESVRQRPLAAADMPASFTYGALGPASAEYLAAVDARRGHEVRRMVMAAGSELAMIDVVTLQGDYIFNEGSFRRQIESQLNDQPIDWQDSGSLDGPRPTRLQTFALPDAKLSCVGLRRALKRHTDAPTDSGYSQTIAVGLYCRPGAAIALDEAARIATALQTQG